MTKHQYFVYGYNTTENRYYTGSCVAYKIDDAIKNFRDMECTVNGVYDLGQVHANTDTEILFIQTSCREINPEIDKCMLRHMNAKLNQIINDTIL